MVSRVAEALVLRGDIAWAKFRAGAPSEFDFGNSPFERCRSSHRRTPGLARNSGVTTTGLPLVAIGPEGYLIKIIERKCHSGSPRIAHGLVHFKRQGFDALCERLHCFRKLSVLPDHLDKKGCLLCRKRRPFLARGVQSLTMFRIGDGMSYVAVGLPGLRQQYERSRICGLQAEGEI